MQLVGILFISQLESIVRTASDIPIEITEEALVIVNQRLSTYLSIHVAMLQLCPYLIQPVTSILVDLRILSPDADLLSRNFQFEVVCTHITNRQPSTVIDKGGEIISLSTRENGTIAILGT